jgi:hypothetical protein
LDNKINESFNNMREKLLLKTGYIRRKGRGKRTEGRQDWLKKGTGI